MLWFRFWIDRSEGVTWLQSRILGGKAPRSPFEAIIRLWLALRLSWVYHRCLDIAALVLEPE
jgi:hypothetical protein